MKIPCQRLETYPCIEDHEVLTDVEDRGKPTDLVEEPALTTTEAPHVRRPSRLNRAYVLVPPMPKRPPAIRSCLAPCATPLSPTTSAPSSKQVRSEKRCREELKKRAMEYYSGMADLQRVMWETLEGEENPDDWTE